MAEPHPAATHHLPPFITPPGETDVLMVVMGGVLLLAIMAFGILFLRLHSLPERIAHKSHKLQFELVAVLALIALFTHLHIFWIAALLLAIIDLPDFGTSLGRMAGSLEKIAAIRTGEGAADVSLASPSEVRGAQAEGEEPVDMPPVRHEMAAAAIKSSEGSAATTTDPRTDPMDTKERVHA